MSVAMQEIWEEIRVHFGGKIIAGDAGLKREVEWLHIVENSDIVSFLHGNELIFTTGLADGSPEWLMSLVVCLQQKNACGLAINRGKYIEQIPAEVIAFCREQGFPLIEIPWKVPLVDVTRRLSMLINNQERKEISISEAFRNAILSHEMDSCYTSVLLENRFDPDGEYRVILVKDGKQFCDCTAFDRNHKLQRGFRIEKEQMAVFLQDTYFYIVLANQKGRKEMDEAFLLKWFAEVKFSGKMAVGPWIQGVRKLKDSFRIAERMLNLTGETLILDYEQMGVERLLLNQENMDLKDAFCQEVLGKLLESDRVNHTRYIELLQEYFACDCSIKMMSEKNFCHRNTVTYQIRKMKEILHVDLERMEDRTQIFLALKFLKWG